MNIDFILPGRRVGCPLSPRIVAAGVPGTEEAYIHMAKQLAGLGHGVTVYADCRDEAGPYDGVLWRDLETLRRNPPLPDVLVTSSPEIVEVAHRFGARRIYLWLHVDFDPAEVLARSGQWFKIMPISLHSRRTYGGIPDERVFLTRNGIDPAQFEIEVERIPFRLAYGSDYDRGLGVLLHWWPRIRDAVPEATLSVFYGWEIFEQKVEALRRAGSPLLRDWLALKTRLATGLTQDGVEHLGRVGHERVALEFLRAEVWAYPCTFPETSCITAMKAQAAGAVPVVFPTAALRETVRFGLRTAHDPLERPDLAPALSEAWAMGVIATLRDREGQVRLRPEMRQFARSHLAWSAIAREWSAEFVAAF